MAPISKLQELALWDQMAPRAYIRFNLCFPLDTDQRPAFEAHFQASLNRFARQRPDFAGTLRESIRKKPGFVSLQYPLDGEQPTIPFATVDFTRSFAMSYDELRECHFPADMFVGRHMNPSNVGLGVGKAGIPMSKVEAFFIDGGVVVAIMLHHTGNDGMCMKAFMECLAAHTRRDKTPEHSADRELALHPSVYKNPGGRSWQDLVRETPEFGVLPSAGGPSQPIVMPGGPPVSSIPVAGKIFVFSTAGMKRLIDTVTRAATELDSTGAPQLLSRYAVLAGFIWAHMTAARQNEPFSPEAAPRKTARLVTPVDWRTRAFSDAVQEYFGNVIASATTVYPTQDLLRAAGDEAALARLVVEITSSIAGVNEDYIRQRARLFKTIPDPRHLGMVWDVRTRQDLHFNTWRNFGGDIQWDITGEGKPAAPPAAIRRAQDVFNIGGGLVMPRRVGLEDEYEVLLTMPEESMKRLMGDVVFMSFVSVVR